MQFKWRIEINAVTFRPVHFGHGCGGEVSVNDIQKEISWVVVRLARVAWNTGRKHPCLKWPVLY